MSEKNSKKFGKDNYNKFYNNRNNSNKKKNKKKQTSFTLKERNYEKLQKLAKERDTSVSAILDKILDEILN